MPLDTAILKAIWATFPTGFDAFLRIGLAEVLGEEFDALSDEVTPYLKRLNILRHRNGFVEVRLDFISRSHSGRCLFCIDPNARGYTPGARGLPVLFGEQAGQAAEANLMQLGATPGRLAFPLGSSSVAEGSGSDYQVPHWLTLLGRA